MYLGTWLCGERSRKGNAIPSYDMAGTTYARQLNLDTYIERKEKRKKKKKMKKKEKSEGKTEKK